MEVEALDSSTIITIVALVVVGLLVLSLAGVVLSVQSFRSLTGVVGELASLAAKFLPATPTPTYTEKEVHEDGTQKEPPEVSPPDGA